MPQQTTRGLADHKNNIDRNSRDKLNKVLSYAKYMINSYQMAQKEKQEGLAVATIARDVGSSSTNRSSDIMHFLPRLLKKTLQHER